MSQKKKKKKTERKEKPGIKIIVLKCPAVFWEFQRENKKNELLVSNDILYAMNTRIKSMGELKEWKIRGGEEEEEDIKSIKR